MVDLILDLIDFNEGIDYSFVSRIVVLYLVVLWIFVSVWVFNDAKYRFGSKFVAFLFSILNFFLSFPFLLIYLLVRPSHRDEWDDALESGGINIPVANFVGKEGVTISFNLKINSKKILDENSDYKLDISLDNEDGTQTENIIVESTGVMIPSEDDNKKQVKSLSSLKRLSITIKNVFKSTLELIVKPFSSLRQKVQSKRQSKTNKFEMIDESQNMYEPNNSKIAQKKSSKESKKKNKSKKKKKK